jgi:hypothetical protein
MSDFAIRNIDKEIVAQVVTRQSVASQGKRSPSWRSPGGKIGESRDARSRLFTRVRGFRVVYQPPGRGVMGEGFFRAFPPVQSRKDLQHRNRLS